MQHCIIIRQKNKSPVGSHCGDSLRLEGRHTAWRIPYIGNDTRACKYSTHFDYCALIEPRRT